MEVNSGMYSVLDSKAECFCPPFIARTDYEAQRLFEDVVSKPGMVADHPEDFALYRVGFWDAAKGVVVPCSHASLGVASDFRKVERHD